MSDPAYPPPPLEPQSPVPERERERPTATILAVVLIAILSVVLLLLVFGGDDDGDPGASASPSASLSASGSAGTLSFDDPFGGRQPGGRERCAVGPGRVGTSQRHRAARGDPAGGLNGRGHCRWRATSRGAHDRRCGGGHPGGRRGALPDQRSDRSRPRRGGRIFLVPRHVHARVSRLAAEPAGWRPDAVRLVRLRCRQRGLRRAPFGAVPGEHGYRWAVCRHGLGAPRLSRRATADRRGNLRLWRVRRPRAGDVRTGVARRPEGPHLHPAVGSPPVGHRADGAPRPPDIPELGAEQAGSVLRVTGHFNDARSTECVIASGEPGEEVPADDLAAEWYCRLGFVVESWEVVGTDPDWQGG